MNVAGIDVADAVLISGGHVCTAWRGRTPTGEPVFAKTVSTAPPDFFTAEAAGLDRLRVDGGPPVPGVRAAGPDGLVLDWVEPGPPTAAAAREFGRRLAVLHTQSAHPQSGRSFGADRDGWIATLPLDNATAESWPEFYAERRLAPYLDDLEPETQRVVSRVVERLADLAGPPEPPALIHGDLWSGNLLWAADGDIWLVDAAAAHVGHRETDIAMLALFGAPYLDEVLAGYDDVAPLAAGWRDRVGLHQLHPLLVHAQLFGRGYEGQVRAVAAALLDS